MNESLQHEEGRVVQLASYREDEGRLDPEALSDEEIVEFVLAYATHPSVVGSAAKTAASLLKILPTDRAMSEVASNDWLARTGSISVSAAELDDDDYDSIAADEVVKAALAVIRSKNGHHAGNEQIVEAARALIDFRAGILLNHAEIQDNFKEKWEATVRSLGTVALGVDK